MTKIGQDGHDRGLICIASALADLGFDIDLLPLFPTVLDIVNCAVYNNVHLIGVSSMAGSHVNLIPKLISEIESNNIIIPIILGGIIQKTNIQNCIKWE